MLLLFCELFSINGTKVYQQFTASAETMEDMKLPYGFSSRHFSLNASYYIVGTVECRETSSSERQ